MRARSFIAAGLWSIAVVATICGLILWSSGRSERDKAATIRGDLAALMAQRKSLEGRLREAESESAGLRGVLDGERRATTSRNSPSVVMERIHSDPAIQKLYLNWQRSGATIKYASFVHQLHLSPEQVAKFEENVARHAEERMDLDAALQDYRIPSDDSVAKVMRQEVEETYKAAQKDLLGEDGLAALNAYDKEITARMAVNGFAGIATLSGLTLTPEQVAQMAALAVQASHPVAGASGSTTTGVDWDALDAQAASVLSPQQLDLFRSGEFIGPIGYGSKYFSRFTSRLIAADHSDAQTAGSGTKGP